MAYTRKELSDGKLASLRPQVVEGIVYATGRVQARGSNSVQRLPILSYYDPIAYQFLKYVHETDHAGPSKTIMKSKQVYWIMKARKLAMKIKQ